jgi:hypothetical protein
MLKKQIGRKSDRIERASYLSQFWINALAEDAVHWAATLPPPKQ